MVHQRQDARIVEKLTLEQASSRLGVHPTTLRRWADEGAIDVFVTPGGHRRFRIDDIERFEARHQQPARALAVREQQWAAHAIAHAREGISSQRWLAGYGEPEREAQRNLGRRLMGMLFQYIAGPEESPDLLAEAREMGERHAREGIRLGRTLAEMLDAITFFRTTLLEVTITEHSRSTAAQPDANTKLLRRIERLVGEIQSAVVKVYTGDNQR